MRETLTSYLLGGWMDEGNPYILSFGWMDEGNPYLDFDISFLKIRQKLTEYGS